MISCISGLPGKGKNVYATYLAKKHFERENNLFRRLIRRLKHEEIYSNGICRNDGPESGGMQQRGRKGDSCDNCSAGGRRDRDFNGRGKTGNHYH